MKKSLAFLIMTLPGALFANDVVFEIHWKADENGNASAIQADPVVDFATLNTNPIHFSTVPGSIVYKMGRTGVAFSISRGLGSRVFLKVGNNEVEYKFHLKNTIVLEAGTFQSSFFQTINGRPRTICETLMVAGQPARGSCKARFNMTLDELDPQLAAQLRYLTAELARLKKYSRIDEFKNRFKLAEDLLKRIEGIEFSELSELEFESYQRARDTILNLRKDIGVLESEIQDTRNRIKESLEKKGNILRDELRRAGVEDLSPPNLELNFSYSEGTQDSGSEGDTFDHDDNIYKTYANEVMDNLRSDLERNDRLAFLANVETWTKTVATYEKLARDRQFFSKKEWQNYIEQYEVVSRFIDQHLDKDLWFKDSPVPVELRESLKGYLRELASVESAGLESELKKLSSKDLSVEKQRGVQIAQELARIANELKKYSKHEEVLPEFKQQVRDTASAIADGLSCFAKAQLSSRVGSFYELVTGKSICDGSELSTTERVLSGVELALGAPKLLKFLGAVTGIGSFAKKAEKVVALSSDVSKSVGNMAEFFKTKFGSLLQGKIMKTAETVQGQSIYRVESQVVISPEITLNRGHLFYLDAKHKDHLEVFTARRRAFTVLNLDGTVNVKKMKKSIDEGRRI